MSAALTDFETRLLDAIRHHLAGLRAKVVRDFSAAAYAQELAALARDPVYSKFGLACGEYVLVRLIGRISISVGRRLGEIYDKVPRFVAAARFKLQPEQVAEVFDNLELDIALRTKNLSTADAAFLNREIAKISGGQHGGIGIEIRYNFNPNDSARLRKDVDVVNKLKANGLLPIYLIFSSISPRNEAIRRLTKAGWIFKQGQDAIGFINHLMDADVLSVLDRPAIAEEVKREMGEIMQSIFSSEAMGAIQR